MERYLGNQSAMRSRSSASLRSQRPVHCTEARSTFSCVSSLAQIWAYQDCADCDHEESARAINRGLEKRESGYLIHTGGIGIFWDASNGNVLGGKIWRTWASYAGTQLKPCTVVSKRYIPLTANVFLLLIIIIIVFKAPSSIRVAGKIYGISTSVKQFTIPSHRTLRLRFHYRH